MPGGTLAQPCDDGYFVVGGVVNADDNKHRHSDDDDDDDKAPVHDNDDQDSLEGDVVSAHVTSTPVTSSGNTRVTLRRDVSPAQPPSSSRIQRDVTHLTPLNIDTTTSTLSVSHDVSHLDISRDSLDADSLIDDDVDDDDAVTSQRRSADIVSGETPSNDQMSPSTPFTSLLSVYKDDASPRGPSRQLRVSGVRTYVVLVRVQVRVQGQGTAPPPSITTTTAANISTPTSTTKSPYHLRGVLTTLPN